MEGKCSHTDSSKDIESSTHILKKAHTLNLKATLLLVSPNSQKYSASLFLIEKTDMRKTELRIDTKISASTSQNTT